MEYAPGGSLSFRLSSKLTLEVVTNYLTQAANGLDFAHQNGTIHRDLKPSNILFSANDQLVLADFGVAHEDNSELTDSGIGLGTAEYMAPEQFSDAKHAGITTDIYSLGVIAFQMLTGHLPFGSRREGKSLYELITAHEKQAVPVITELNTDFSPGLQNVLEKALAKTPAARYQSAAEFASAFQSAILPDHLTIALLLPQENTQVPTQLLAENFSGQARTPIPSPPIDEPSMTTPLPSVTP